MTRLKRKKEIPGKHPDDIRFGTPFEVADYRAERVCEGKDTVIEIGAGAGFQTKSFAERCELVIAVDIDSERLGRGSFPDNVITIAGDALDQQVIDRIKSEIKGIPVVFLDPERPASSKKRTISEIQPDLRKFVEAYSEITKNICIELPPFLEEIPWECEKEFLSIDGELNRLDIYMGDLKKCDISVIRLPEWKKYEHSGKLMRKEPSKVENPKYILLPDRALEHSGLTEEVLPDKFETIELGNKRAFLVETLVSSIFTTHKIVAYGKENVKISLSEFASVVLHGKLEQNEQKDLLKELNEYCKGRGRAHIFLAEKWFLTTR